MAISRDVLFQEVESEISSKKSNLVECLMSIAIWFVVIRFLSETVTSILSRLSPELFLARPLRPLRPSRPLLRVAPG